MDMQVGLHDDVHTLEMGPKGWRRIGEATVQKGVGGDQVTEFVVNFRSRRAQDGMHHGTDGKGGHTDSEHGKPPDSPVRTRLS